MEKKNMKISFEAHNPVLNEKILNKIFEVLPIGLWFVDGDGTLLKGNPEGIKIWGAEPKVNPKEYGVFKAKFVSTGEEVKPTDWALYKSIKYKKTILNEILEINSFDGKTKIINNSTAPILSDNKKVLGAIVVNKEITEEENLKKELIKTKDFFEDVLNGIPHPLFVKNDKNEFLFVNKSFCELFKCSKKKIIGRKNIPRISKNYTGVFFNKNADLVLNDDDIYEELPIIINKKNFIFLIKRTLICNEDDKFIVVLAKDISARKINELKIKESEEKYRNIFNNSPEGIILINNKGKIIKANQRIYDWLGYTKEDVEGKNIFSIPIISLKNKKEIFSDILFNKKSKRKYRFECIKKDKSKIFFEITKGVNNGKNNTNLIFVRNLDENIRLKDEINNLSNKLTNMVEKSSESIVITDAKGKIEYVNPHFEKLTRYNKSEIMGIYFENLFSDKHSEIFFKEMWKKLKSGEVWQGQVISKKKLGEEFTEDMTITPIKNDSGKIINFIALKYDITHLKDYEQKLQEHIQELEQFRDLTVDRELKMIELEKENKELKRRLKL